MPWRGWGRCGGESEWVWVLIGPACSPAADSVHPPEGVASIHRCDPRRGHLVGCDWVLGWVREPPLWCDWVGFSSGATPGLEAGLEWHRTASPTVVYRWTQAIRHAHHVRACVKAIPPPPASSGLTHSLVPEGPRQCSKIHTGGGLLAAVCPCGESQVGPRGEGMAGLYTPGGQEASGTSHPLPGGWEARGRSGHAVGHTCVTCLR